MANLFLARATSSVSMPDFKRTLVDWCSNDICRARAGGVRSANRASIGQRFDSEHGGDLTAQELVKRFRLLDEESSNVVDFYFLGWQQTDEPGESQRLKFDLEAFEQFRTSLRQNGVGNFGGNADLILLDAWYKDRRVALDFSKVMYLNLSQAAKSNAIDTLGAFLQELIEVGGKFRAEKTNNSSSATFWISDRLGLAVAKRSAWAFIVEKWGKFMAGEAHAVGYSEHGAGRRHGQAVSTDPDRYCNYRFVLPRYRYERNTSGLFSFRKESANVLGIYVPGDYPVVFDPINLRNNTPYATVIHEQAHQHLMINTSYGLFHQCLEYFAKGSETVRDACRLSLEEQWSVQELDATYSEMVAVAVRYPRLLEESIASAI